MPTNSMFGNFLIARGKYATESRNITTYKDGGMWCAAAWVQSYPNISGRWCVYPRAAIDAREFLSAALAFLALDFGTGPLLFIGMSAISLCA